MTRTTPLLPGRYYHIFNRGNNRENLFHEERNYVYFLRLYKSHIEPVAETFAYCLLPNHFHLLMRVRPDLSPSIQPSRAFANLFNAYARSFNRAYGRVGALFQRPFQRRTVTEEAYFVRLVVYIHQNPQRHGLIDDFREWPYSSYQTLMSMAATRLMREEVLGRFGDAAHFTGAHSEPIAL